MSEKNIPNVDTTGYIKFKRSMVYTQSENIRQQPIPIINSQ
ncbi:MAG: hypothetical protein N4A62_12730 [Marinisporobacter sp.]|nr:hypothetical protein [Marinisporobacter sp.]